MVKKMEETEKNQLNLFQRLIEVRKSCEYLKKDNTGYQFKYVSSSQTLGTLRGAMDQQGLLLVPRVTSHEVRDHETKKGDHEYFTILTMSFTWVNADKPEEQLECQWVGQGLDNGEKGVGKALTYAEKYFLLKFFNIATDKDDPDSFQKKFNEDQTPAPKKQKTQEETAGNQEQRQEQPTTSGDPEAWKAVLDEAKKLGVDELINQFTTHQTKIKAECGNKGFMDVAKHFAKLKVEIV